MTVTPQTFARETDGRNIDDALGTLAGEAAQLEARDLAKAYPTNLSERTIESVGETDVRTYYGLPMVKEPVWIWTIPAYFYVGGLAGAASVVGAAARFGGRGRMQTLSRRARMIAAIGDVASAGLLIADLGRPARFLNMLRVFRPTSPMSMGSWILSSSGALNAAAWVFAPRSGRWARLGAVTEYAGAALGLPLAGYTGVLIANTAVPVWKQTRRALPVLFMASGLASAASAFEMMSLSNIEDRAVRRIAVASKALELASAFALEQEAEAIDGVARPLHEGASGALWMAGKVLGAASLALSIFGRGRTMRRVAGGLGTAAALATRFAVFQAGKVSARDPRATIVQQRAVREGEKLAAITRPAESRSVRASP